MISKYLLKLEEEITKYYKKEKLETIYIGGGTPSALSPNDLERVLILIDKFKKKNIYEYTIEFNPEDLTKEKIKLLKKYGINRVSIGIQTFNDKHQKYLGRNTSYKDVKSKIKLLKEKGIKNISVDLIYGLKDQTLRDLKRDIKKILKLQVPHISTYSLIIEPQTMLYINKEKSIKEEKDAEMYFYIIKKLKKYNHYEISNFSKDGYYSKHNLVYWNNEEYYGFGLGSSGYIEGVRYKNSTDLNIYPKNREKEKINLIEKQEYELILGLRKLEGINKSEFEKKYNRNVIEIEEVKDQIKKRNIIDKNGYIFIPEEKIYISNAILENLVNLQK